jgi:hypothetical protein
MKLIFFEGLKNQIRTFCMSADCFHHWLPFFGRKLKVELSKFLEKHFLILKIPSKTLSENYSGFQKAVYCSKNCFQSRLLGCDSEIVSKAGNDMYTSVHQRK